MLNHTPKPQTETSDDLMVRDGILTEEVTLESRSGLLRGKLSVNLRSASTTGVILCPGLAVGMEGDFITLMGTRLLAEGIAKRALRFNFFGHSHDTFNKDIRGFTFERAADDFSAGVAKLREAGAEKVIAVCSSTGTQPALLAACEGGNREKADLIVARAGVIDFFGSVLKSFQPALVEKWKADGEFQLPVGGTPVKMSAEFLHDIERLSASGVLARLQSPVILIHGAEDKVVPLAVVQEAAQQIPPHLLTLHVIQGAGHDISAQGQDEHLGLMASMVRKGLSSLS